MQPPIHKSEPLEWFDDVPKEPGYYWFYGEPQWGSMGGHYTGAFQPKNRLMLVEVKKISNGVIAVGDGRFLRLHKWDEKSEGFLGRWAQVTIPLTPAKEE